MDVLNSAYSKLSKDLQDKQDVLNQIQDKNISISTEINAMNMLIKSNNEFSDSSFFINKKKVNKYKQ